MYSDLHLEGYERKDETMSRPDENDENVALALAEGRAAEDIFLINCPYCGIASYYNEGSHCQCRECGREIVDQADEMFSLADYWSWSPYPDEDPNRA